jgi:acyl carrier protein
MSTGQLTQDQARTILETTLREIVPDAGLDRVPGDADLREAFELDSLDFVDLVERLSKRAGFRIEDEDAEFLRTQDGATAFLVQRSAAG